MKTAAGAVMLALAVLVLGAAAGGARADPCAGDQPPPKITMNTHKTLLGDYQLYGEHIIINCSAGNSLHLGLKVNGQSVHADVINTTTILIRYKPDLGLYLYSCADIDTGCEVSLGVEVKPALSVQSARVRRKLEEWPQKYFVPLGEEYEVLCSGHDSQFLRIYYGFGREQLQADVVNSTTLRYRARAHRVEEQVEYWCWGNGTGIFDVFNVIKVTFSGVLPAV